MLARFTQKFTNLIVAIKLSKSNKSLKKMTK